LIYTPLVIFNLSNEYLIQKEYILKLIYSYR